MNISRCGALGVLLVASGVASGQTLGQYTPISGKTYEAVLGRLFSGHQARRDGRFQMTVRILPPFAAESEISIAYTVAQQAVVSAITMSKSLRQTLDEHVAAGGGREVEQLAGLVSVKTVRHEVEGEVARGWLRGFWGAIAAEAQEGPARVLKLDGTRELELVLDATTYQIVYSDAEAHYRISVAGGEPELSGDASKLAPLVRWVLEVRRQLEEMKGNPTGG